MAIKDLRILVRLDCPSTTLRFWDGSGGPYVDDDGEIWRAASLTDEALDQIEMAINGESVSLSLAISGCDKTTMDAAWSDYQAGEIVGSKIQILIQALDEDQAPNGDPEVQFTGRIDNLVWDDAVSEAAIGSTLQIAVVNRFALRRLTSGSVLSDIDRKAISAVLNPTASPDRICDRVAGLLNKTVRWPDW
jgi:hypothetical protein